jgi:hypothetical protein
MQPNKLFSVHQIKNSKKNVTLVKKRQTLKAMVISTPSKEIKYLSPCYEGSLHDYRLLKVEFPPEQNWFEKFAIKVDLGYVGIIKDTLCKHIAIPHKKSKHSH